MSMDLMVKAMKVKVGNPLRKLVLLKLADNASDTGECWPSYQHIADQCEIARSTVKVHIRELEKAGLLRREFRRKGELNQSNLFHLTLDGGAVTPSVSGAAENPGGGAVKNPPRAAENPGGGAAENPRTSHSSEPVKEPKKPMADKPAGAFDLFWSAYPKKKAKGDAEKAWAKVKPDHALSELIIAAVLAQKLSADWTKDGGKFIPHPATWLNAKRWEDEVTPATDQSPAKPKSSGPDFYDESWRTDTSDDL